MDYDMQGDSAFPDVSVTLDQGEQIVAEPGAMVSHAPGIEMTTDTGGGGMMETAKRAALGGESVFMNTFTAQRPGTVTLAPPAPGDVSVQFLEDETLYAESGAFLAAEPNVAVSTEFQGASKFFRSGDVFLLELSGVGHVFFDSYGAMRRVDLDGGETIHIDTEHVVAFDASVQYSTYRLGGLKSQAFGGEGKVAEVTGPGTVWLQNRDFESLAEKIGQELPRQAGGSGDEGPGLGDFV